VRFVLRQGDFKPFQDATVGTAVFVGQIRRFQVVELLFGLLQGVLQLVLPVEEFRDRFARHFGYFVFFFEVCVFLFECRLVLCPYVFMKKLLMIIIIFYTTTLSERVRDFLYFLAFARLCLCVSN